MMDQVIELQIEFRVVDFAVAFIVLVAFGVAYNAWVTALEEKGRDRGYMGFIVALGCFVTVLTGLFWPTKNPVVTFFMLLAFAGSGTPMILGSIWRHIKQREEQRKEAQLKEEEQRREAQLKEVVGRLVRHEEPLTDAQQVVLEHVVTGLREMRDGVELALLAAIQLHDATYARMTGSGEEEEERVDTIMKGLHRIQKNSNAEAA